MISPFSVVSAGASALLAGMAANKAYNSVPVLYLSEVDFTGVRIENSRYRQSAEAEISTQVLIAVGTDANGNQSTTKMYITDNVAPGPRSWSIDGWISTTDPLTATFTTVAQLGFDASISKQVKDLWDAFYNRSTIKFKDADGWLYPNVAIASLDFEKDPLTQNKVPISITLKEVNILGISPLGIITSALPSKPTNPATSPASLSDALNAIVADPKTVLNQVFGS